MRTQPDNYIVTLIVLKNKLIKTEDISKQIQIANEIIDLDDLSIEHLRDLLKDYYNFPELKILFKQAIINKANELVLKPILSKLELFYLLKSSQGESEEERIFAEAILKREDMNSYELKNCLSNFCVNKELDEKYRNAISIKKIAEGVKKLTERALI